MDLLQKNCDGMVKASNFDVVEKSENESVLSVFPLDKGYALTLGNALRRVLLTSIWGFAVTSIKIDGVFHEFDLISGIKEDVYDIIMNIKSLLIKKDTSNSSKLIIKTNKKGPVFAKDIKVVGEGEILNKDLLICTIEKDGVLFNAEMNVEYGVGYRPAPFHDDSKELGLIYLDAMFSPVKKVSYVVDSVRVGRKIDYDKLDLTVETDGTIKPVDVVSIAAKILQSQLELFVDFSAKNLENNTSSLSTSIEEKKKSAKNDELDAILHKKVDCLELSIRSANCLKNENIELIGDLVQKVESDMLKFPNFGKKSLDEIKNNLKKYNLSLGMTIPGWRKKK